MRNFYARPKNGAGSLRANSYYYVKACLKKMFYEQENGEQDFKSDSPVPTLKEYFFLGIKHCVELANSGNIEAKQRLPEIFFKLALYYETGDSSYGIVKNLKESNKFLELAIRLESEQRQITAFNQ